MEVIRLTVSLAVSVLFINLVVCQNLVEQDFTPVVTATCKAGFMTVKIQTNSSFIGAVHAKDYRTPSCLTYGNGSNTATLSVNLFAPVESPEYCGVLVSKNKEIEDRSLPVAVRIHRTLELADDKFYVITCGKASFKNSNNETSLVTLSLLDTDKRRKLKEVFYSRSYVLRAEVSRPDGHGIRVKNCFAFNRRNNSVSLIDDRGCPVNVQILSPFTYDEATGHAESKIYSMFQFPDGNQIHFQCDVTVCKGNCSTPNCDDFSPPVRTKDEGVVLASTSVFVLQPGDTPTLAAISDGSSWTSGTWPLYLALALGLLFLLMLILNVVLCSAVTCSCSRSQLVEKEPSVLDDYDPYRSWHGTHYSSRYSLNGKGRGYASGGSTLNSARSVSTNSDHYAIVESSRHSRPQHSSHLSYPKH